MDAEEQEKWNEECLKKLNEDIPECFTEHSDEERAQAKELREKSLKWIKENRQDIPQVGICAPPILHGLDETEKRQLKNEIQQWRDMAEWHAERIKQLENQVNISKAREKSLIEILIGLKYKAINEEEDDDDEY